MEGRGLTSRQLISVTIKPAATNSGIVFHVQKQDGDFAAIPARADNVVHTLRNVVVAADKTRLCLVEHILAAASLYGLDDLIVEVTGQELPIGDGSAKIWLDAFKNAALIPKKISPEIILTEPVMVKKGDRTIFAIPDDHFSISYLMDWHHPAIGKRWHSWNTAIAADEIGIARTFGTLAEHKLLGLQDDVVSLTEDGFSKALHFEDEPVRHKLLDLLGDLTLIGFNPLKIKARIVSIKGGHELDVEFVKRLRQTIR